MILCTLNTYMLKYTIILNTSMQCLYKYYYELYELICLFLQQIENRMKRLESKILYSVDLSLNQEMK